MAAVRLVFAPFWPSSPAKVSRHKVRATASRAYSLATYRTKTVGKEGTLHFRRFFEDDSGTRISPWHDIPLYADNTTSASSQPIYHAVIEIPRTYSNCKFLTKPNQFDCQVQTQFMFYEQLYRCRLCPFVLKFWCQHLRIESICLHARSSLCHCPPWPSRSHWQFCHFILFVQIIFTF